MKKRFYETTTVLIASKGKNNQLFTNDQYLSLILKSKESKNKITKKTPEDYQRLARYDVVKIGASEKLIIPKKSDKETENQGNTTDPSKITQSDQEIVIALDKKKQDIGNIRKLVGQSLKKQADKMLALSSVKYPAANTGDNVVVKIPDVDRAKADDRNIMAVIISQETKGMCKLGTEHGIQLYARNQFISLLQLILFPNMKLPSENVQKKESHLGGQGFLHWNCT
ncbi:unnamed protein product [Parnassius apollo]|uniref:(apollo) hypothetical protein n=1 Tax=Parnassius apollo TaxID=110799 RepID=A0A8S3XCR8_PARAO|nr:unnamed protein product [Parnassius apollo]